MSKTTTTPGRQPDADQSIYSEKSPVPVEKESGRAPGLLFPLLRGIPTILVLAILAGLALWGRHHDWKLPGFSKLAGGESSEVAVWCDAHGVAEADCIACNAELLPKGELYGWCAEHGVHECILHHPQAAQLDVIPNISQDDLGRVARAIAARPPTRNDPGCKMHLRRIQFPSAEAVDRAGVDIGLVDRGPVLETILTTGEIVYDPTRVAQLSSRASGTISRVEKNVGDRVKQGDVLALVDAVELGRAKSQLVQSLIQLDLAKKVAERLSGIDEGAVAGRRIEEAQSAAVELEVAVQKGFEALSNLGLPVNRDELLTRSIPEIQEELRLLGIPASFQSVMESTHLTSNLLPIVSPREGIVVERHAVAGEVVDSNKMLFTVADTSRMWLLLNVRLEQVDRISVGQKTVFRPDGSDCESVGQITWISTDLDIGTRTIRVRSELANNDGQLRNETFGAGGIVLREESQAITVPNSAIHWEGCCYIAFVRDKNWFQEGSYKIFHTRSVRPGAVMGDYTEVIAGLLPGEVVVTKGSGILRAELLKGNLGAG